MQVLLIIVGINLIIALVVSVILSRKNIYKWGEIAKENSKQAMESNKEEIELLKKIYILIKKWSDEQNDKK